MANSPNPKLSRLLDAAAEQMRAGQMNRAEDSARKALKLAPDNRSALLTLAVICLQDGRQDYAASLLRKLLARTPQDVEALYNLGVALLGAGKAAEAAQAFTQALTLRPELMQARFNLAVACQQMGQLDEAEAHLRSLTAVPQARKQLGALLLLRQDFAGAEALLAEFPQDPEALNNRGLSLRGLEREDEALALFQKAVALAPDFAEAAANLTNTLLALRLWSQAVDILTPLPQPEAKFGLARALMMMRRPAEAVTVLEALPEDEAALLAKAEALLLAGRCSEAEVCSRRATALAPQSAAAWAGLSGALLSLAEPDAAIAALDKALTLAPDDVGLWSNLAMSACYHPGLSLEQLAEINRRVGHAIAPETPPRPPKRQGGGALRIGYISADLCRHSVASFLLPMVEKHDRAAVHLTFYCDVGRPDAVTAQFQALADRWHDSGPWQDDRLEQQIRADEIDVLVDLGGHTGNNRQAVFAARPAPLQMSWLGYGATTGLEAMDGLLADGHLIPEDGREWFAERIWRLPCTHSFTPPIETPPPGPPPSARGKPITFGSFNNGPKLGRPTIALWARVLAAVPESRLLLKTGQLADIAFRDKLLAQFVAQGIAADRIEMRSHTDGIAEHLGLYDAMDVALDTTPYGGATTSAEALWMGVPVVSLCGERLVSRYGRSMLSAVGLGHLAVADEDAFVATAKALAEDTAELTRLRASLRQTMAASPLCDAEALARGLERRLRQEWDALP